MNKSFFLKTLPILLFSTLTSCSNFNNKNNEKIFVEQPHYNFGTISKLTIDSINFTFKITNNTDDFIKIHGIDKSCDCISVNSFPKELKPNSTNYIIGKIGNVQSGKMNKSIFVNYDDSEVLILRITGEVK